MENEEYSGSRFLMIPWRMIHDGKLSPISVLLFGLIVLFSDKEGYCTASNGYLANELKITERGVQKLLAGLESEGYITRLPQDENQVRKLYAHLDCRGDEPRFVGGERRFMGDEQRFTPQLKKENLASSLASPLSSSLNNPISNPTPNSFSLEKKERQVSGSSEGYSLDKGCGEKATATTEERTQALFEQFWKAYPRKDSKKAAFKAFMRIPNLEDEFPRIMEAVDTAKKSEQWNEDHGKFIPYPATYLNGEKWKDEGTQTQEDKMNEALRGLNELFGIKEVF